MIDRAAYQVPAVQKAVASLQQGRHVCLVSPTGSGKSVMARAIVRAYINPITPPERVSVLTHRYELAAQMKGHLPGIHVRSWQAVARSTRQTYPDHLLVIDECHHSVTGGPWQEALARFPNATRLGLTATPKDGLAQVFDEMIVAARYSELLRLGAIVPCRVFRPTEELDGLAKRPVDEYLLRTPGQQAICFAGSVEDARQIADEFCAAGVFAGVLTGETNKALRNDTIERFRTGALRVLVNVFVATEGFDVPDCSVCIIARGCESVGTYLQMVGRVLRPADGKVCAYLLDLRGVSWRHGAPTQDREYALSGVTIKAAGDPLRMCPRCGWTYEPGPARCPTCAYRPSAEEVRRQRVLGVETAEAVELKPADPGELNRLLGLARDRGYSAEWAVRAYRKTHNKLTAWPQQLYGQVYESLRKTGASRKEAHARARKALL